MQVASCFCTYPHCPWQIKFMTRLKVVSSIGCVLTTAKLHEQQDKACGQAWTYRKLCYVAPNETPLADGNWWQVKLLKHHHPSLTDNVCPLDSTQLLIQPLAFAVTIVVLSRMIWVAFRCILFLFLLLENFNLHIISTVCPP